MIVTADSIAGNLLLFFLAKQIAPIFDGFLLERGVRQLSLGGKDVTKQLAASVNAKVTYIHAYSET